MKTPITSGKGKVKARRIKVSPNALPFIPSPTPTKRQSTLVREQQARLLRHAIDAGTQ